MADNIVDDILMQAHIVEQRANGLYQDMVEVLETSLQDVVEKMAAMQARIDIDFNDLAAQRQLEYLTLQKLEIEKVIAETYEKMKQPLLAAAKDVFTYTAKSTVKFFAPFLLVSLAVPTLRESLVEKWFTMTTVGGLLINEWLGKLERNAADRIIQAGRQAMIEAMTIPQTARFMKKQGIEGSKPALEGLARTFCMSAANYARDETIKEQFSDIIAGWQYVACLDGRTCPVCGNDDLRKYKPDEKRPSLPRHWRCRCVYVPLVSLSDEFSKLTETGRQNILDFIRKDRDTLKIKQYSEELEEYYKTAEYSHRPSVKHTSRVVKHRDGSTSTKFKVDKVWYMSQKISYNEWLKQMLEKDPEFVRSILGKTRFELFKSGKITLNQMTIKGRLKNISDLV